MMRSLDIRLAGILAAVLILLTVFLFSRAGQDQSLNRVRQAGVLVIALDASYPPFETTDGRGNYGGFDVDLGRLIAARLGVQAAFKNIAFDSLYDALFSRQADLLISGLHYEAERTRDVIYTVPYLDAGQVFIIRKEDSAAGNADMAGRRVAVETASEGDIAARKATDKFKGMTVQGYTSPEEMVQALVAGQADAAVSDYVSAMAALRQQPGLRLLLPPFSGDPLVAAGDARDSALMRQVSRIVKAARDDGTLSRLAEQWF